MSNRGGSRSGAGRKKGSVTAHRKLANEATVRAVGNDVTPLEYLLAVMRTDSDDARRLDAAKAAAPYVHPKLSSVEMNANVDISQEDRLSLLERRANGSAAAYSQ
jgi:hypothetical protein